MKKQIHQNYLRAHRKRSGLSQRELGLLLGYQDKGQISRHEHSERVPPLVAALAYEAVFRISISALFVNVLTKETIERKLEELEQSLTQRDARERGAEAIARKLIWLKERKKR